MNLNTSRTIFSSPKGLQIAFEEVKKIKEIICNTVEKITKATPNYNIIITDNKHHITNLMFNGKTLFARFYESSLNVADGSFLLFAVVNGYFNKDNYVDPFNPITKTEIIRLDFSYNESGEFGWRNQESKDDFYKSQKITEIWIEKFMKESLKKNKN